MVTIEYEINMIFAYQKAFHELQEQFKELVRELVKEVVREVVRLCSLPLSPTWNRGFRELQGELQGSKIQGQMQSLEASEL